MGLLSRERVSHKVALFLLEVPVARRGSRAKRLGPEVEGTGQRSWVGGVHLLFPFTAFSSNQRLSCPYIPPHHTHQFSLGVLDPPQNLYYTSLCPRTSLSRWLLYPFHFCFSSLPSITTPLPETWPYVAQACPEPRCSQR